MKTQVFSFCYLHEIDYEIEGHCSVKCTSEREKRARHSKVCIQSKIVIYICVIVGISFCPLTFSAGVISDSKEGGA